MQKRPSHAQLPKVHVSCGIDKNNLAENHVTGELETKASSGPVTWTAKIHLALEYSEILVLESDDPTQRLCVENVPGDERTLTTLISLLTALRDALVVERPVMLEKAREFEAMLDSFDTTPTARAQRRKSA